MITIPLCEKCQSPMNVVPAGISRKTNKPYPSFLSCPNCKATMNIPEADQGRASRMGAENKFRADMRDEGIRELAEEKRESIERIHGEKMSAIELAHRENMRAAAISAAAQVIAARIISKEIGYSCDSIEILARQYLEFIIIGDERI